MKKQRSSMGVVAYGVAAALILASLGVPEAWASPRETEELVPPGADPGLRRFMARVKKRILRCFIIGLDRGDITQGGSITLGYELSPDGTVTPTLLRGTLLRYPAFVSCALRAVMHGRAKPEHGKSFKPCTHRFTLAIGTKRFPDRFPVPRLQGTNQGARTDHGMVPSNADPGLRKFMAKVRARIVRCFRKGVAKGTIKRDGTITVKYRVLPQGKLRVLRLGGSLASSKEFAKCVRRALTTGRARPQKGRTFAPMVHSFTMILSAH